MHAYQRVAIAREKDPEFWAEYDAMHGMTMLELRKPEVSTRVEQLQAEFAQRIRDVEEPVTADEPVPTDNA